MRKHILLTSILSISLLVGCYENQPSSVSVAQLETFTPTHDISQPLISPVPTASETSTVVPTLKPILTTIPTSTPFPTITPLTPTIPPELHIDNQCIDVQPSVSIDITFNGRIIFAPIGVNELIQPEIYMFDVQKGTMLQGDSGANVIISPDKKLMAYTITISNPKNNTIQKDLVIADANGQQLKVITWGEDWLSLLSWSDNQHLILSKPESSEEGAQKPLSTLILNPFSGEKQLITPNFSRFLSTSSVLPYWDGWFGVIYAPDLTRAIYPRFNEGNTEQATYALWNFEKNQLVTSLDATVSIPSDFVDIFPKPAWAPDSSRFVFRNRYITTESVDLELYSVTRDGELESLTQLSPFATLDDVVSWSPDNQHIAVFLYFQDMDKDIVQVAVLDSITKEIINYCIPINLSDGNEPSLPIWSPDGTQFLVVNQSRTNRRQVILVDIVQGFAAQIAEDMEPVGWMVAP